MTSVELCFDILRRGLVSEITSTGFFLIYEFDAIEVIVAGRAIRVVAGLPFGEASGIVMGNPFPNC